MLQIPTQILGDALTTRSFDVVKENKNLEITDFNTKHFRVVMDTDNPEIIDYVRRNLEESYTDLENKFNFKIKHRIRVVVDTKYDNYSGYTDILERRIYLSLGVPMEVEGYGNSFIRSLIQHELAHYFVAHFIEKIPFGIGRSIGWVIIPMWFHEGVSEYFSAKWDTFNDILARNAFLNNRVSMNSMLTFYYSDTLGRRMGYNLGFSFIKYISSRYGEKLIFKILKKVKRFKFQFRRILRVCSKETCSDLIKNWILEEKKKYEEMSLGKVECSTLGEIIDNKSKMSLNPIFSNDGKGLYYSSNRDSDYMKFSIYYMDFKNKKVRKVVKNVHYRFTVSPNMEEIIFSKRNIYKNGEVVSDLYKFNQKTRKTSRLTKFYLADNPSFSTDGKRILFTSGKSCRKNIWIMDSNGENKRKLTDFAIGEAAYSPMFSNDLSEILFTFRSEEGKSYIGKLSGVNYKKFSIIGNGDKFLLRPEMSKLNSGNKNIYFILGDGNFLNLAIWKENGEIRKLTDIKSGIMDFNISSNGKKIAISEINSNGIRIILANSSKLSEGKVELNSNFLKVKFNAPDLSKIEMPNLLLKYNGVPEFQYFIPWIDWSGGNPLLGFRTKLSDPLRDNEIEITALKGTDNYKKNILTFTMKGMNPMFGFNLYDISDEFRPSQNRTYKGVDFFSSIRINPNTYLMGTAYKREITSNSISPIYSLRHPLTGDVNEKDAGVTGKFVYYKAERTINRDIHPVNVSAIIAQNIRTSSALNSFYSYKMSRFNLIRSFIINKKRDQITLKYQYGHTSGDYEFQFGGIGELRGYKTLPFVGQRISSASIELNLNALKYSFINNYLSLTKIYPTLFVDRGSAYYNKAVWHNSYGVEFSSRILLFNKISLAAKYGVAIREDDKESEFFGNLIMDF